MSIFVDYTFISLLITNLCPTDSGGEPLGIYRSSHYSSASEIEGLRIRTTSGYDHPYDVASLKIQTERVSTGEQFDLIGLIACVCVEKYNFYFNIIFYKKDLASLNSTHYSILVGNRLLSISISIHRSGKNNKSLIQSYKNVGGVGF